MTYELARKLKEAGFPQRHDDDNWPPKKYLAPDKKIIDGKPEPTFSKELVYVPTSDELIEELGDNLESMIRRGNGTGDDWEVRSKTDRYNASSLIEALAELYCAIHKKK
jgi:hypothetical protein